MAKVSKSKGADLGPLFHVAMYIDGPLPLKSPVIVERQAGGLLITAGRFGSSKRDLRFIPSRDIQYAKGTEGVEGAIIRARTSFKELAIVGHLISSSPDSVTFQDQDGGTHVFATNDPSVRLEITAALADGDGAPKAKKKVAKPAPAAPEAAPKKKKKVAAPEPAPVAKKKKKV